MLLRLGFHSVIGLFLGLVGFVHLIMASMYASSSPWVLGNVSLEKYARPWDLTLLLLDILTFHVLLAAYHVEMAACAPEHFLSRWIIFVYMAVSVVWWSYGWWVLVYPCIAQQLPLIQSPLLLFLALLWAIHPARCIVMYVCLQPHVNPPVSLA